MNKARWRYDCTNCTFEWNCGPLCHCILKSTAPTPSDRVDEVKALRLLAGLEVSYGD